MARKKTNQKQLKRNIKEAVQAIPKLIAAEHISKLQHGPVPLHYGVKPINRRKRYSLWGAVSIVSLLVFFMWYWNMRSIFSHLWHLPESQEGVLVSHAASEVRQAIQAPSPSAQNPSAAADLDTKEKIRAILRGAFATSSIATSTQVSSTLHQ